MPKARGSAWTDLYEAVPELVVRVGLSVAAGMGEWLRHGLAGAAEIGREAMKKPESDRPSEESSARGQGVPPELRSGDIPLGQCGGRKVFLQARYLRHLLVQGATRMGKTEWAVNLVLNRAKAGVGSAYLDNADGQAVLKILAGLPDECLARTVVLYHSRKEYPVPVGFYPTSNNIFVRDSLVNWWEAFFIENFGIEDQYRTRELIAMACRAAFSLPGATLLEVVELIRNPDLRAGILNHLNPTFDNDVRSYWDRYKQDSNVGDSFLTRAGLITSRLALKLILCQQARQPYPYRQWMDEGWTVLVVAKDSMDALAVRTIMSLHMLNFWSVAKGRDDDDLPIDQRAPFMVVADEPQSWLSNNVNILDDIFSKGLKYGLGMTCLFQSTEQIARQSKSLLQVMLANAPDLVLFRGDADSEIQRLSPVKLGELPTHQFVLRVQGHQPMVCQSEKAPYVVSRPEFVQAQIERWGKPYQEVAEEIDRRRKAWSDHGSTVSQFALPRRGSRQTAEAASQSGTGRSSGSSGRIKL